MPSGCFTEPPRPLPPGKRNFRPPSCSTAVIISRDGQPCGLVIADGKPIGPKGNRQMRGMFVAEPKGMSPDLPRATILDLLDHPVDPKKLPWTQGVQSFPLLLDYKGNIRVKDSEKKSHRTVIATDRNGNILVFNTSNRFFTFAGDGRVPQGQQIRYRFRPEPGWRHGSATLDQNQGFRIFFSPVLGEFPSAAIVRSAEVPCCPPWWGCFRARTDPHGQLTLYWGPENSAAWRWNAWPGRMPPPVSWWWITTRRPWPRCLARRSPGWTGAAAEAIAFLVRHLGDDRPVGLDHPHGAGTRGLPLALGGSPARLAAGGGAGHIGRSAPGPGAARRASCI